MERYDFQKKKQCKEIGFCCLFGFNSSFLLNNLECEDGSFYIL